MNNLEFLKSKGFRTTLIPYKDANKEDYLVNLMIEHSDWIYLQITFEQEGLNEKLHTKVYEEEELA